MEVILLCHAATRAMKAARFPVGDEPAEHEERLPFLIPETHRVISSPARAARDIAQAIAQSYDIDSAFDDIDYGRWRGRAIRDISEQHPDEIRAWLNDPHARPHDGESIAMVAERVAKALDRLASENGPSCIVVTHAIVVKAAIVHIGGEPLTNILKMNIAPLSSTTLKLSRSS